MPKNQSVREEEQYIIRVSDPINLADTFLEKLTDVFSGMFEDRREMKPK